MFQLSVKTRFAAAHKIDGYPGDCARIHGHNFGVEMLVNCSHQDEIGIAIDLRQLKKLLSYEVEKLDHQLLNDLPFFEQNSTTSENIARYLFSVLEAKIKEYGGKLYAIRIEESPETAVTFFKPSTEAPAD